VQMNALFKDQNRTLHQLETVDAYIEHGNGTPVLLIHGVGLKAEAWGAQIPTLAKHHKVYALDLPGHGYSSRISTTIPTLSDFSARIARFIDQVIGEPAVCIGHSLGALICLNLATDHAENVSAFVALSPIVQRSEAAQAAVQQRAQALADAIGGAWKASRNQ